MSNLIECLKCGGEFTPAGMMYNYSHKSQICISCAEKVRAERRAERALAKKKQLEERMLAQKLEREAKALELEDLDTDAKPRKKRLSKESKMLEVDARLYDIRMAKQIKEDCGL